MFNVDLELLKKEGVFNFLAKVVEIGVPVNYSTSGSEKHGILRGIMPLLNLGESTSLYFVGEYEDNTIPKYELDSAIREPGSCRLGKCWFTSSPL